MNLSVKNNYTLSKSTKVTPWIDGLVTEITSIEDLLWLVENNPKRQLLQELWWKKSAKLLAE